MKHDRYGKFTVLLIVLFFAVAGFSAADSSLQEVQHKINDKTKIEQLQVRQDQGKVVLEGLANTLSDKQKAEDIAKKEMKNSAVENQIALRSSEKSDSEITLDVLARIKAKSSHSYLFNTLGVKTEGGNVILQGKLRDAYLKDVAEKAAKEVPGVRSVRNLIEILPVSSGDDRLRAAIYQSFRRDDHLSSYFLSPDPSINIIVENARVTLIGYVNTQGDKQRAGTMARGINGVLSVENELQVQ